MLVLTFAIFGALSFGYSWFDARGRARAFNRVTGKNVSTWDAMWLELRVVEPSIPRSP